MSRRAQRFTVLGERLTVPEIAERAGLSRSAIRGRLALGVRGDALLAPPRCIGTAKLVDVGGGRWMTYRQIAAVAGITVGTVSARYTRGLRGEALLAPPDPEAARARRNGRDYRTYHHNSRVVGVTIGRLFANKPPSLEYLQTRMGMSRASAYRWLAAWRESSGEHP
jgi:predicted DNA-binding transcriptional regulator AlpA